MEAIESFLRKEFGGAVVEVGIKLVNHRLKSQHRKKTAGKSWKIIVMRGIGFEHHEYTEASFFYYYWKAKKKLNTSAIK